MRLGKKSKSENRKKNAKKKKQPEAAGAPRRRCRFYRRPPPGTLIVDKAAPEPKIRIIAFDKDDMVEARPESVDEILEFLGKWSVTWINVDGLGDAEVLLQIGALFNLHRLALEDVVNVNQRAKVEHFDDHVYVVMRMLSFEERLRSEQFSMFIGSDHVLTFQERRGDYFEPVRERLRLAQGRVRERKPDYLGYTLIDALIDSYFPIMERYDERLDVLEQSVQEMSDKNALNHLHAVRKDLTALRRAVWPKREALNSLVRDPVPLVDERTRLYLRDCYDHTIQIIDMLENLREIASGLVDLYMSGVSNRMNEVMKVLTVIATIFIPLSFIAGLYGMNFDPAVSSWNMPELGWPFGYPLLLAIMAAVALGQLYLFRKKGWISWPRRPKGDGKVNGEN